MANVWPDLSGLPLWLKVAIGVYAIFLLLMLARSVWMRAQERAAIRADLERRGIDGGRMCRVNVWRNCGSAGVAFRLLVLDYEVRHTGSDQHEVRLRYTAEFVFILGKLRRLHDAHWFDP